MELLRWENLLFLTPLLLGVLYTLLMSVIGIGDQGDADLDADAEAHLEADGADASEADAHWLGDALSFLGIGKAPLSVLLSTASLLWGAAGLIGNILLGYRAIPLTIGIAGVAMVFGTGFVARLVARLLPTLETYHATPFELWGQTGIALYSITAQGGTARLTDKLNNLLDLECRTFPGEESIAAGAEVLLEEYDQDKNLYYVRPTR